MFLEIKPTELVPLFKLCQECLFLFKIEWMTARYKVIKGFHRGSRTSLRVRKQSELTSSVEVLIYSRELTGFMWLDVIPPAVEANLLLIKACVLRCRTGKTLLGHLKVFKCPKVLKFTCHLCHGKSISISHVHTQCRERLCLFKT